MHTDDRGRSYNQLTLSDHGKILRLNAEGLTQAQIAQALACNQSTVSRSLAELGEDTTELAIHKLKVGALGAANRVIADLGTSGKVGLDAAKFTLNANGIGNAVQNLGQSLQVYVGVALPGMPGGPVLDGSGLATEAKVHTETHSSLSHNGAVDAQLVESK